MAEVLAPIVSQTSSITMLHSPSDAFANPASTQTHQPTRTPAMSRYNAQGSGMGYRGTSTAPIAPYAFQSTPQLRQEHRANSAPTNPYSAAASQNNANNGKQWHPSNPSSSSDSTTSTASSSRSFSASKDDSVIHSGKTPKGVDGMDTKPANSISFSTTLPDLSLAFDAPVKASPNRYRRNPQRTDSNGPPTPTQQQPNPPVPANRASAAPSGSGMAAVAHLYKPNDALIPPRPGHTRTSSADDSQLPRQGNSEQAKRYRRRSVGGFEGDLSLAPVPDFAPGAKAASPAASKRPESKDGKSSKNAKSSTSFHERNASGDSVASSSSNRPSSRHSSRPSSARQDSGRPSSSSASHSPSASGQARGVSIPPRNSSDATKRLANPSPLSKPVTHEPESPQKAGSPALQQLAALNENNKGMKSRLRRAFSFGSAAELRRASAENNLSKRKDMTPEEIEAEHEAIAAKQEAAGIGAGIYSGQGGFTGSTDNLSISSTASSASIMLRKMGKGMKKGTRSLKGLFRPKSVIGVPASDKAITQPSLAQVSMVTVEAEREKVNVNANPHDQIGGGTGYPKLERNSLDAAAAARDVPGSSAGKGPGSDSFARKSIVGGDKERAEVLAAVRKGILKRTGTNSDSGSPVVRSADHTDSPNSTAPSTPADDHIQTHGQLPGTDYFNGLPRLPNMSTKSLPTTPHGSRSISFSPRIQFHDAWSSSEYDRRGDIATCNRLTPMLAQQIKEELNSFKMEMEVHELSKPHTHFF